MGSRMRCYSFVFVVVLVLLAGPSLAAPADLILYNGKIVTADREFSIHRALAVENSRIVDIGPNERILARKGPATEVVDLAGRTVLPGLIDSHVHPTGAAMTEFDHPIPEMESIADVLAYVRGRAAVLPPGAWIVVRQVFITRLREQRYPTRAELDAAAPRHPVLFSTGPDAVANTLALKESGIDRHFKVQDGGPGYIELDPQTGAPTGVLRGCTRYVKTSSSGRQPTQDDSYRRLAELLRDYSANGITGIIDRSSGESALRLYEKLLEAGRLPVRVAASYNIGTIGPIEKVQESIRKVARHRLARPSPALRVIGVKTFLDGGMLTGSAYMLQPWGTSSIYAITDPTYRGVLNIPPDRLLPIVETCVREGLQFTAHSVGDGAVHALLDAYEAVNAKTPVRPTRPCLTHANFMTERAVAQAARLGVVVDIQPAWLYLDARTLTDQFGYERLRWFQPLKSIFAAGGIAGGGSDHMQKIGALRAVNFYHPFFAMWVAMTRQAKWYEGRLHPEEALSREQALRFYTIHNAYIMFLDDQTGSLEPGKLADMIVVDTDLLTCPVDAIPKTRVVETYLGGRRVFQRDAAP